jgi:hypothetical protein
VESVCYTRATVGISEAPAQRIDPVIATSNTDNVLPAEPEPEPHNAVRPVTPRPIYVSADHTPNHPTQSINIGPIDYSNYLKRQYPKLVIYRRLECAIDPFSFVLFIYNKLSTVLILNYLFFCISTDG